jgi:carboxyl-terminal processing protease
MRSWAQFSRMVFLAILIRSATCQQAPSQMTGSDRDMVKIMLRVVAGDVKKHYYDPKLHGVNWDAKLLETTEKIEKETSLNMALSHVAAALDSLNDSHTFFVPPSRPYRHDFGFHVQIIGERCLVTRVRRQSDAAIKGVTPGDEVLSINGYTPTRDNLWKLEFMFKILRPQPQLRVGLRHPDGSQRDIIVLPKFRDTSLLTDLTSGTDIWRLVREEEDQGHLMRFRLAEVGSDLLIIKLPWFFFTQSEVEGVIGKARQHKSLILDLRGNPGGSVDTLKFMIRNIFDNDVKIGDRVQRDKTETITAKSSRHSFDGKLVVLVDSESASASEILSRIVQLEKRGMVLGDRTAGSVMEARHYSYQIGVDIVSFYGASITDANLVMTDGQSLEHLGVTPAETVLPTATDLASGRDPVLARAAELLGGKLSPEDAGKLFPYEWPKQ